LYFERFGNDTRWKEKLKEFLEKKSKTVFVSELSKKILIDSGSYSLPMHSF